MAAVAAALLFAGCGAGQSSTATPQPQDQTPTIATPGASGGHSEDAVSQIPAGTAAAGEIPAVGHAGGSQLVHDGGQITHTGATLTHGDIPAPSTASDSDTASTPAATTPASTTATTTTTPSDSKATSKGKPKSHTIVRYKTRYLDVDVPVLPDVPVGAYLPSSRILHVKHFTVRYGNLACELSSDGARCDIHQRQWRVPRQPTSCKLTWGGGLEVSGDQKPGFVCASNSLLVSHLRQINPGYDDIIGDTVCQVRSFGVDCFVSHHHGFMISRTGYVLF